MSRRYVIKIKIEKTLLMFADNETEARGKIQDYIDKDTTDNVETISVERVNKFF